MSMIKRALITLISVGALQAHAQQQQCFNGTPICTEGPETRVIDGVSITRDCWAWDVPHICYEETSLQNSCADQDISAWHLENDFNVVYMFNDSAQPRISWDSLYTHDERVVTQCAQNVADIFCDGNTENCTLADKDCTLTESQCTDTEDRPVDGHAGAILHRDCWDTRTSYACYNTNRTQNCDADFSGCTVTGFDCTREDPNKLPDPVYGKCVEWTDRYVCADMANVDCPVDDMGNCTQSLTQNAPILNADGQVIGYQESRICVEPTDTCPVDEGCAVTTQSCDEYDEYGICIQQTSVIHCDTTQEVCTQYTLNNTCPGVDEAITKAFVKPDNFTAVKAPVMIMDQMVEETSLDVPTQTLRFFSGDEAHCKWVTDEAKIEASVMSLGTIGAVIASAELSGIDLDCCKDDPDDVSLGLNYCQDSDVQLATKREQNLAYQVGGSYEVSDFCTIPNPLGGCLHEITTQRGRGYCTYDSILSKIINIQGREQLAEMVSVGAGPVATVTANFDYFIPDLHQTTGVDRVGRWSQPTEVNGNKVAFWQWNEACKSSTFALEGLQNTNDQAFCPPTTRTLYVAVCEQDDCGDLPVDPRLKMGRWEITTIGANRPDPGGQYMNQPLSRYVVAEGYCEEIKQCQVRAPAANVFGVSDAACSAIPACNTTNATCIDQSDVGSCEYKLHAWPMGVGGQVRVYTDLGWYMFGMESNWSPQIVTAGPYQFQYYQYLVTELLTAVPRIRYRETTTGSGPWTEIELPRSISEPIELATTPIPIRITGDCSSSYCGYRLEAQVPVEAKPWGTGEDPDCTGFTQEQMMVLDFDKMDLAEAVEAIPVPTPPSEDQLMNLAMTGTANFQDTFNTSGLQNTQQAETKMVRITPDAGVTPFTVTLTISGTMVVGDGLNAATETVLGAKVDWADSSAIQDALPYQAGFQLTHLYNPDGRGIAGETINGWCYFTGPPERLDTIYISDAADREAYCTGQGGAFTSILQPEIHVTVRTASGEHLVKAIVNIYARPADTTKETDSGAGMGSGTMLQPSLLPSGANANDTPAQLKPTYQ